MLEQRSVRREAERQANKLRKSQPNFGVRIVTRAKRHWKTALAVIGVPTIGDLIREFVRGRAMDWLFSKVGSIGQWILTYPLAMFTIGVSCFVLWIAFIVIQEWSVKEESLVLDQYGKPSQKPRRISTKQAFVFVGSIVIAVSFVAYGAYRYYQINAGALLEKYPMGYVLLDVHSEKSFFPYPVQGELRNWRIDWTSFSYSEHESPNGRVIRVNLPNIQVGGSVFYSNALECPEKLGKLCGLRAIVARNGIGISGEILSIRRSGTVIVLGFAPLNRAGIATSD